ncbi:MAG: T9SS type A sorting domain-containing protein [Chlorobi bacterium]|nr:T9SS type A sorting domain-containing protein [Chlorobiota bacterium]
MKKLIYILLFINLQFAIGNLQTQGITWQKFYGSGSVDIAYSILQTPDGGYITTGRYTTSNGNLFIMKLNQYGDSVWMRSFPHGWASDIEKTNDGNYIIAGNFGSLIKINNNSDTLWVKQPNWVDRFSSIKQTSDNGFIICGAKDEINTYKPLLQKYDSFGNLQWSKVFTNGFYDGGFTDVLIGPSEFVLIGIFADTIPIYNRMFLMKTDFSGNQTFFMPYDSIGTPMTILSSNDNGYIIGGSGPPGISAFLSKFSVSGNLLWRRVYDPGNRLGKCNYVAKTFDGGYALTGEWDTAGTFDAYIRLIKTDSLGNEQWRKAYGYIDDHASFCVQQTADTGYIISGYIGVSFDDLYFIKTDKNGYANPPIGIHEISNETPLEFKLFQNFPNPFNSTTKIRYQVNRQAKISIKVYNVLGQEIKTLMNREQKVGIYEITFTGNNLSTGLYLYRLIVEGIIIDTKKMIIIK